MSDLVGVTATLMSKGTRNFMESASVLRKVIFQAPSRLQGGVFPGVKEHITGPAQFTAELHDSTYDGDAQSFLDSFSLFSKLLPATMKAIEMMTSTNERK
mmetsp:Transcript_34264/g.71977  ORF Transcript_34264/g.71977 Transcript_34264/m.71977 type:complete len:100 (+) Transcript_34264:360-659(+)